MEDKCCFCGEIWGALIRLYQGWCCVSCFKELLSYKSLSKESLHKLKSLSTSQIEGTGQIQLAKLKVTIIDNNPLSVASYIEEHPNVDL